MYFENLKDFITEAKIHSTFNHKNIIRFYKFFFCMKTNQFYYLMEFGKMNSEFFLSEKSNFKKNYF